MSVNRVSFGKVIDVFYRYNVNNTKGKEKASAMHNRADNLDFSDTNILRKSFDVRFTAQPEPELRLLDKGYRVITDDDLKVYHFFRSAYSKNVAEKYADKKAEKFTIDV